MKYLKQMWIILLISFAGEALRSVLPLPVPASIYGLLIMLFGLMTHIISLDDVEETGNFLLTVMPLMFIPAAVGLLETWSLLKPIIWEIAVIMLVSTVFVMAFSGRVTQTFIRKRAEKKKRERKENDENAYH